MEELTLYNHKNDVGRSPTLRDLLAIAFRHRRLMVLSFLGILSGAILVAVLQPSRYDAGMKILVKRDRADPIVTSDATAPPQAAPEVSEEELNSEVELLKGRELLKKVVLGCDLQHPKHRTGFGIFAATPANSGTSRNTNSPPIVLSASGGPMPASQHTSAASSLLPPAPVATISLHNGDPASTEDVRIANAVLALEKDLRVEVVKKTDLIAVTYQSRDAQMAARVLGILANLYLEKHVTVHRPPGTFNFFQQETERYREALAKAEERLVDFNQSADVVSAPLEKDVTLQKLAEFKVALSQTKAAMAETQQRILKLQEEAVSTPKRMVTQVRNTDDGMLLSQLRSNLLGLEQKRTELLGKFEPSYRPVQDIEAQIAQTRVALASAEKSQLHEEITDRDPTYEWGRAELAKAKADLAGLQARAEATVSTLRLYEESARSLGQKEVAQNDLLRTIKANEENYLLYRRKEEEARMSDALDRGRILNVAIAEAASVPSLPSNHRSRTVLLGVILAALVSAGLAFVAERLNSTFRTPDELGTILNIPVLATIPLPEKKGAVTYVS